MEFARRILRDPLIHFLLGGAALFALFALFQGDRRSADETTIVVDEATLVNYLQYRSQAFEPGYFDTVFDAMGPAEKQQLVDAYVREEAMVREAHALGLDDVDYVIRQRLIQKMLFLVDGTEDATNPPTDEELEAYFQANQDVYRAPESLTFTHVFIDNEKDHPGGGQQAAEQAKAQLTARGAGFNDAPQYGDRFPYLQNYVGRSPEFVANQFGPDFTAALAKLEPSSQWQGPIRSEYGWHVVLLTKRDKAVTPKLADIRDQVASDFMAERAEAVRLRSVDDLLSHYTVLISGLEGVSAPEPASD